MPNNFMLEIFQHKYLPNKQVLEFVEKGILANGGSFYKQIFFFLIRLVKIVSVENILRAHLAARFEKKLKKKNFSE